MRILVINSGSSSVKFELFELADTDRSLVEGEVERIGSEDASMWIERRDGGEPGREQRAIAAPDHRAALETALDTMGVAARDGLVGLAAVGHRVVHGGDRFSAPTRIDDAVIAGIAELALLAPLHTHANLAGVEAARACLPDIPQIAVFDTAFHRTMPTRARTYALPRDITGSYGIHRYGFHGISHAYVARRAAVMLGRPLEELDLITLHLGNGASATAIHAGRSIDTSMGMTPLEGLVMGTRSGDVDPAVPMLLSEITGRTREDVHRLLNHESGLKGLCGASDMREIHVLADAGNVEAQEALDLYCYRAKKYVGAYLAALGRLDGLVFTAGVGEHDADVRSRICSGLTGLGIEINPERNYAESGGERFISSEGAPTAVLVIPTDEELEIARITRDCLTDKPACHDGDIRRGSDPAADGGHSR